MILGLYVFWKYYVAWVHFLINFRLTVGPSLFSGVDVPCALYDRCAARAFNSKPADPTVPLSVMLSFVRISFNDNGFSTHIDIDFCLSKYH